MEKNQIKERIKKLKLNSGTHSPSIDAIISEIPEIKIKVDSCFLSNPYATELFINYLENDLIKTHEFKNVLEYYPPQNSTIAKYVSKVTNISSENIFVGNGAIEIIQALLQKYVKGKVCIILPTFSSYYEFLNEDTEPVFYYLQKENNFHLDCSDYIDFVKRNDCKSVVIINPNNPDGGYIKKSEITRIIESFRDLENVIIDESFIHFAYEDLELENMSLSNLIDEYPNLSIVKSMSKDFGIAGIRCGYSILSKNKVKELLKNGFLWNISGLGNYFFKLYADLDFQEKYEVVRKKYIMNTMMLISQLSQLKYLKVYPSKSNFVLIELPSSISSFDFTIKLLVDYGIYVRDCSDKIGLNGNFIRLASRSFEENLLVIKALKEIEHSI
jgi:histidinol-phosphate/aromatic aminotransferase/cobyric acid decarboxylase-like protein